MDTKNAVTKMKYSHKISILLLITCFIVVGNPPTNKCKKKMIQTSMDMLMKPFRSMVKRF